MFVKILGIIITLNVLIVVCVAKPAWSIYKFNLGRTTCFNKTGLTEEEKNQYAKIYEDGILNDKPRPELPEKYYCYVGCFAKTQGQFTSDNKWANGTLNIKNYLSDEQSQQVDECLWKTTGGDECDAAKEMILCFETHAADGYKKQHEAIHKLIAHN